MFVGIRKLSGAAVDRGREPRESGPGYGFLVTRFPVICPKGGPGILFC